MRILGKKIISSEGIKMDSIFPYGAVELKESYSKYMTVGLCISTVIHLILIWLFFTQNVAKESVRVIRIKKYSELEFTSPISDSKNEILRYVPTLNQEVAQNYILIKKEEESDSLKLRDRLEDVKLHLDVEPNNSLLASSQIDNITYSGFLSSRAQHDRGASLNINSDANAFTNHLNDSPDFKLNTSRPGKQIVANSVELKAPDLTPTPNLKNTETESPKNDARLIKISENQFLLNESESTIGTYEYRLWNKINAVIDRLDKNRFGNLPQNVQRSTNGLTIFFHYDNGVQHEIFWSKGGKVIIRVTGTSPRQISDELQRAFDSLVHLTI